jgi:hypothetical protein
MKKGPPEIIRKPFFKEASAGVEPAMADLQCIQSVFAEFSILADSVFVSVFDVTITGSMQRRGAMLGAK